jgi:hypothetical protein
VRAGPERFSFRQGALKRGERITVLTSRRAPPARPTARGRPRDGRRLVWWPVVVLRASLLESKSN